MQTVVGRQFVSVDFVRLTVASDSLGDVTLTFSMQFGSIWLVSRRVDTFVVATVLPVHQRISHNQLGK